VTPRDASSKEKDRLKYTLTLTSIQRPEKAPRLRLSEKQVNAFLFAAEGVGAAFVGIFLAAYLAGIPTTVVYHSEPAFRISLIILGIILLVMVLSVSVLAALSKKEE
jgi:F0F1-type ATP synthase assembly protein I